MRRLSPILLFLSLTHCAPPSNNSSAGDNSEPGVRSYTDKKGTPYVLGGAPERGTQTPPKPGDPVFVPEEPAASTHPRAPISTPVKNDKDLRARLKEFQISRYSAKNELARFGKGRFELTIFFRNEEPVKFEDNFGRGSKLTMFVKSARFTLSGVFTDDEPEATVADLQLTDNITKQTVDIQYWAYRASSDFIINNNAKLPSGSVRDFLANVQKDCLAWVNNWAVSQGLLDGPVFYLIDIIKLIEAGKPAPPLFPLVTLKGESLRTGEEDHEVQASLGDLNASTTMIGNSETTRGHRVFQVVVPDASSGNSDEIILDVVQSKPTPLPTPSRPPEIDKPTTSPPPYEPPPGSIPSTGLPPNTRPSPGSGQTAPPPPPPSVPVPRPPTPPPPPDDPRPSTPAPTPRAPEKPIVAQPAITGNSYFTVDNSRPRTKMMSEHFARNFNSANVQAWIKSYQRSPQKLNQFYYYANPFRALIEGLAAAYDVSTAFVFLTVNESDYFSNGRNGTYHIATSSAGALGPFQFMDNTVNAVKLRGGKGSDDERRFFAPSACAGARYIGELVNEFSEDATVAILGFAQGKGGAARSVICSETHQDCNGKNYGRYLSLSKNYHFSFQRIDEAAMIPKSQRDYINNYLAVYFISSNLQGYGLAFPSKAPTAVPANGIPTTAIQDGFCRATVSALGY